MTETASGPGESISFPESLLFFNKRLWVHVGPFPRSLFQSSIRRPSHGLSSSYRASRFFGCFGTYSWRDALYSEIPPDRLRELLGIDLVTSKTPCTCEQSSACDYS